MDKEHFSLKLAVTDSLPILFFAIAALTLGMKLHSPAFFAGAVICIAAGTGKVLWKLILALKGKDVSLLGAQLRFLMPAGFILIITGAVTSDQNVARRLLRSALHMPSIIFFIIALIGLIGMILCAAKYDRHDVRGNWIEQIINSLAQCCVMIGVLLL